MIKSKKTEERPAPAAAEIVLQDGSGEARELAQLLSTVSPNSVEASLARTVQSSTADAPAPFKLAVEDVLDFAEADVDLVIRRLNGLQHDNYSTHVANAMSHLKSALDSLKAAQLEQAEKQPALGV